MELTLRAPLVRPFLKWAGGKFQILDRILEALPRGSQLVEAFAGSGAVFLNASFEHYVVNDINPDLINLYCTLQDGGEEFIRYVESFFSPDTNQEEAYYELRQRFNTTSNAAEKAALLVYLNRHGYNGLVRYNSKHQFNVPFGRYRRPYFPLEEMRHFYACSQRATFRCVDFAEVMGQAKRGTVIYADPPYVPLSATSSFTSYSSDGFGVDDQNRLGEVAEQTAAKGVPVLISNHDTPFTRKIYARARLIHFQVQRSISCRGEARNKVDELLALFEPTY